MKFSKYFYFILLFFAINFLQAEEITSIISGKVTGDNGLPIPNVTVTLIEPSYSINTDADGKFSFSEISNGLYNISFRKTGYESQTKLITISGTDATINITLQKSLIETSTIDVTSSFEAQSISQSTYSLATISAKKLLQEISNNLGSTIANIPGVSTLSTGIGIGKPVIRGLTANSVLIVHDGIKHESQQWGDEHAPEISLYDIESIEILRGPASLMYGSEGIGGVVNIISKPLQFASDKKHILYGDLNFGGFTVNREGTGNITLGTGFKNIAFKGHFGYRKSGNLGTPDGIFLIHTLNPNVYDTIQGGELSNSGTKEMEGGVSLGIKTKAGFIDAGFETFDREIQLHSEDVLSTGNQKLNTKQFEISGNFQLSKKFHLEPQISYQFHNRREYESIEDKENDIANLHWQLYNFQGDLHLNNDLTENLSGTFGVTYGAMKNKSLGIEKLIPNFTSQNYGIYAFEKYNKNKFTFSFGLRYDYKTIDIQNTDMGSSEIQARKINYSAISGSAGTVFRPNENIDIFANLGRGWRAPSEFELYVNGVHEGTNRFESGLLVQNSGSSPDIETSLNFDFGVRTRFNKINFEISLYNNIINNFIYPSSANIIDSLSNLPVYNISQSKAIFRGFEYSFQYQPFEFMLITLSGDYVFTKNTATSNPLPFTPPMKLIAEVRLQKNQLGILSNPYFKTSLKYSAAQNNVDQYETPTDSYTLFNAGAGFDIIFSKSIISFDLNAENIFNTKYVDHLSRFKSFALNPGRNIALKVNIPFSI